MQILSLTKNDELWKLLGKCSLLIVSNLDTIGLKKLIFIAFQGILMSWILGID